MPSIITEIVYTDLTSQSTLRQLDSRKKYSCYPWTCSLKILKFGKVGGAVENNSGNGSAQVFAGRLACEIFAALSDYPS